MQHYGFRNFRGRENCLTNDTASQHVSCAHGAVWLVLTFAFEVTLGRLAMGPPGDTSGRNSTSRAAL
jgi:hypothetical protein